MEWLSLKPLAAVCASIHFSAQVLPSCTSLPLFSTTFPGSFCLTTHAFLRCVCVCVWERARRCFTASMAFAASDWSWMWIGEKKKEKEKKRKKKHLSPFHSINHDSSFSSTSLVPPLVPTFIATHLSPCHHICIHPPANYTAPFPQTTLISNDVFSACVGIRNINGG